MSGEHFPFELPNPPYKRPGWHRARWTATSEEIARLGGRICGPGEVRSGDGNGLTAGHVQSSPAASGKLPSDCCDSSELVRDDDAAGFAGVEGDSAVSSDDLAWGIRLLP